MKKKYLLTPGPTPVAESTLTAMSQPIIHHRHPEYKGILGEVRAGLKKLFQTQRETVILAGSGTAAMEASIVGTMKKGDRVVVVRGGKFGERWGEIAEVYGLEVDNIDVPWGNAVDPAQVKARIEKKPAKAVLVQYTETSTGVVHPIKELAQITKGTDTLLIVDGITGVGVDPIPFDEWGLDILLTGSQKALMLPPGLALVCVSEKALKAMDDSDLPKFYLDLKKEYKKVSESSSAYTSPITLVIGLGEMLARVNELGWDKVYAENARMARATRSAMAALGLKLYAPDAPSNALTAVLAPEGIDAQEIVKIMREEHGVTIAGGQAEAKGKIFRIAHMGYISPWDILVAIGALETTLSGLGHGFAPGAGAAAYLKALSE